MLQDKPDFQIANLTARRPLYQRYLGGQHWILFPHTLEVARRPDGAPDFQVDLVRSAEAGLAAYGVVDFRVKPVLDFEGARTEEPRAKVTAGGFSGGWLRLQVREPSKTDSATILPPQRVSSNGLGASRLASRLTPEAASLLKRSLLEDSLVLEAWAEMIVEGVAPRFPVTLEFKGGDLERIRKPGSDTGLVRRGDVVGALAASEAIAGLPANLSRTEVAEAVADRLFSMLGTQEPSPDKDFTECWSLAWDTGETRLRFDLSHPQLATRMMILRFDPVTFLRAAAGAGGVERLIIQRELPDFRTGYVPVLVTANLPDARTPALSCGVDVSAKAKPPNRLNAIRETVEFAPPRDRQELVLRFAANEEPKYEIETFVFAQTTSGVQEWRSPRRAHAGNELRLGPVDFPARFIPVEASRQLLQEGAVSLTARWDSFAQTIRLTEKQPTDALVCQATVNPVELVCQLDPPTLSLHATLPAADRLFLDLPLFREFGSHQVQVEMDFQDGPEVVAVQFKPESEADTEATTLAFTRAKPKRDYLWFARSPRSPGYRYRGFATSDPGPWSAAQSPFEPLRLKAAELLKPAGIIGGTS